MAINIASQSPSDASRGHSDAGGQAASPSGPQLPQEEQVRAALARQYTQPYGATDNAIRNALGMRGPTADFVGHNAQTGRWLIAESKGSDLWKAYEQLQNTAKGLLTKQP